MILTKMEQNTDPVGFDAPYSKIHDDVYWFKPKYCSYSPYKHYLFTNNN